MHILYTRSKMDEDISIFTKSTSLEKGHQLNMGTLSLSYVQIYNKKHTSFPKNRQKAAKKKACFNF